MAVEHLKYSICHSGTKFLIFKNVTKRPAWWLMPVILVTWETEIWRVVVQEHFVPSPK
jgi:hypothetical protein